MSEVCFHAVGRRKKAIARVRLIPGEGNIIINKRSIDDYFGYETLKTVVRQPLVLTETNGRFDVIVNCDKLVLTGRKLDQKLYRYHTGYPGGLKEIKYRKLMQNKSTFAFKEAVRRMLPKGPLGYAMLKKLHAYAGPEHTHQAQKPVEYKL